MPAAAPSIEIHDLKERSGLTWAQLARAMGVSPRTLHLWHEGGGISASHEMRLRELRSLVDSIDSGYPDDVRGQLLEPVGGRSLLALLREGVALRSLVLAAPWRVHARADLRRNAAARLHDGIVDEDYAFLLYLAEEEVRQFEQRAEPLLMEPDTTRRSWDEELDAAFSKVHQPEPPMPQVSDEPSDESDNELVALFDAGELGVRLGVGAIARARTVV